MGNTYTIKVTTGAEDLYGNSLKDEFLTTFRIGSDSERPQVVNIDPVNNTTIEDTTSTITITFSEPIKRASLFNAFSINPSVSGFFTWDQAEDAEDTYIFNPVSAWEWQQEYEITINTTLVDLQENQLAQDYKSSFLLASTVDNNPPEIIFIGTTDELINMDISEPWGTNWDIFIIFSKQVMSDDIDKGILDFQPSVNFDIEGDINNQDRIVIKMQNRFLWNTTYTLTIKPGISDQYGNTTTVARSYRFTTNHSEFEPPQISAVYAPEYTSDPTPAISYPDDPDPLVMFDNFPLQSEDDEKVEDYFFDFYISHAQGKDIQSEVFLESLSKSITAPNFSIDFLRIETIETGFTVPQPPYLAATDERIIRVYCDVENPVVTDSGLVTFTISTDFHDTADNYLENEWQLILNKIDAVVP